MKEIFRSEPTFDDFPASSFQNGFAHPYMPIIVDSSPEKIILGNWGLIPSWAKDTNIQKSTINAKLETLEEKPSFKNSVHKRCLVLVKGFYEWKWLDDKGKSKERYYIQLANHSEAFSLGGVYSIWQNPVNSTEMVTFSIVTTEANALMSEIHNTKKRMPLVLNEAAAHAWLGNYNEKKFAFPVYDPKLNAAVC